MAVIALSVALAVCVLVLIALADLTRLRLIHLAIFGTPLTIISLHAASGDWRVPALAAVGASSLAAGYYATIALRAVRGAPLGSHGPSLASTDDGIYRPDRRDVRLAPTIVIFVAIFSAYNFAIAGIPIFSGDVEHARFEYADSGLFGLPSRMYLYGVVVALAVAVAEAKLRGTSPTRDFWVRLAFLTLLVTRILSGFKSGLIDVATTTIIVAIVYCGGLSIRKMLGRLLLAGVVAAAFVFVIGSTYGSYANNGLSLVGTIETRLTSESAKPVLIVYNAAEAGLADSRKPIQMDLEYFANRYAHIGPAQPYGFTRLIAARYAGSDPTSSLLIAPVVLSIYAVFNYQFGTYFGLLACVILGIVLARVESVGHRLRDHPLPFGLLAGLAQMLVALVSRGELVYSVLNWAGTLFTLVAVAGLSSWWQKRRYPRPSTHAGVGSRTS